MRMIEKHKAVLDYIEKNGIVTTSRVARAFKNTPKTTLKMLRRYESKGLIEKVESQTGAQSATWRRTEITLANWLAKNNKATVEITIKPDLAAMWLRESQPHWEKKSIPIVRSIGLGARLDTSLR